MIVIQVKSAAVMTGWSPEKSAVLFGSQSGEIEKSEAHQMALE